MSKVFEEAYLTSLGVVALSYEKAASIAKKLIEKGELAGERQQKFITDLLEEAKKNTSDISKIISERMEYLAEKGEPIKEKQDQLIKDLADTAKKGGAITQEKLKEIVAEVVKKGKEVKENQQKVVKDLKEKVTKTDEEKIQEVLESLELPTKEDLNEIRGKLDILIEKMKKKGKLK
jgi:polyhydroxyalkanoate synthesis regulator phasin